MLPPLRRPLRLAHPLPFGARSRRLDGHRHEHLSDDPATLDTTDRGRSLEDDAVRQCRLREALDVVRDELVPTGERRECLAGAIQCQ